MFYGSSTVSKCKSRKRKSDLLAIVKIAQKPRLKAIAVPRIALQFRTLHRCCQALLSILFCIFALKGYAGTFAESNIRAVQWLEAQQDTSDGSWHGNSLARTFLQTSEAVLALHQANRRQTAYYAGQTWIENHEPQNIDARARRLLVLRATQSNAQQDIESLLAAVSYPTAGQSGWGLATRYRAAPLDTALVLDALRTAGASFSSSQAIAYLKASQLSLAEDKGWPTAAGVASDAYTTARVILALAPYKDSDASLITPLANAIATLKTKVTTSTAPHVRAATALAYLRMNPTSSDASVLLESLVSIQRADGGFDAGIFATGLIIQAFSVAEGTESATNRERVNITDAALRSAINSALGRGAMDQINKGELAQLTTLDISNQGVTNLDGLQYAINLTTLFAANNAINDTSPIAGLVGLTTKDLSGNPCVGCNTEIASSDADVPLPPWSLVLLGAALMGAVGRAGHFGSSRIKNRQKTDKQRTHP